MENYAAAAQILAGMNVSVGGATIAEGIAVRDVGPLPMSILRDRGGVEIVVAPEKLIEKALILLIEIERRSPEGAGAGLAALLAAPDKFRAARSGSSCRAAISTRARSPMC